MHFESQIFQVKCDLTDTFLVTFRHTSGKKIVPMLIMRKNAIFHVTCHDVTVHQNKFAIVFYFVSVLHFSNQIVPSQKVTRLLQNNTREKLNTVFKHNFQR